MDEQIYKKILYLPYYGVFDHITFQNNGGVVTLSGDVLSVGTISQAVNAVKDVPGVTQVINDIEQLQSGSLDTHIRRQMLRQFANTPVIGGLVTTPQPSVRIIVHNGRVSLEGYAYNRGDINTMNILANGVSGVFQVTNNLKVGKEEYR